MGFRREFRNDLALVCSSHHLSDLDDLQRYKTSQPYGNSDDETANVHYAALILRCADLLHITSDRTPSVMYRLIAPHDPVSQREWAKQRAVRRVRPQKGRDRDGKFSDTAPQDTIEVFATFDEADGFFGLTSYLRYAEKELAQASDWALAAAEQRDVHYLLPWRHVDDSEVTATGFLPEKLSFALDQDRILELLTGHTLYGDSTVAVRELIQNALDAARLQMIVDGKSEDEGLVKVRWDSDKRVLRICDNGTGMSQAVIERNLLKAGASRYQEEDFKRDHPDFSPISRFGIGVLSTFMIADSVEITTCAPEEEAARQITLRSVHGRYLVRLLDKDTDAEAARLAPHGTEVALDVRAGVELEDIVEIVKRWIVVPRCTVMVQVDDEEPVAVGFPTPKAALESVLVEGGADLSDRQEPTNGATKVVEEIEAGVAVAYAVVWSAYFREWEFLRASDPATLLGTCVEGIRVEQGTPGYDGVSFIAMCDARGPNAPKTNVARSGLDRTPERTALLRRIYSKYFGHVTAECEALDTVRGQSITRAAEEARILFAPLVPREGPSQAGREPVPLVDKSVFESESQRHALLLVEAGGDRKFVAADEIGDDATIWTVDSEFVRAAEHLLREIPSHANLSSLAKAFATDAFTPPTGTILIGYDGHWLPHGVALRDRAVATINVRPEERRVDVGWVEGEDSDKWISFFDDSYVRQVYVLSSDAWGGGIGVRVALSPVDGEGLVDLSGVRTHGMLYILHGVPAGEYLMQLRDRCNDDIYGEFALRTGTGTVMRFLTAYRRPPNVQETVERWLTERAEFRVGAAVEDLVDAPALIEALATTSSNVFDTWAWSRRSSLAGD